MTLIQTSKNAQQENKGTSTSQEQKQEQRLPIRHAGRPADLLYPILSIDLSIYEFSTLAE